MTRWFFTAGRVFCFLFFFFLVLFGVGWFGLIWEERGFCGMEDDRGRKSNEVGEKEYRIESSLAEPRVELR